MPWVDVRSVVEPQVNAEGIHVWPFDPSLPVDVRFFRFSKYGLVRPRRHDYFEVLYMHRGQMNAQLHDTSTQVRAGELMVMNSTIYHSTSRMPGMPPAFAIVLYFMPEVVAMDGHEGISSEYLMPFHGMDTQFPHIIPAESPVPCEVAQLMRRISAELPAATRRARLAVHTYLRMILLLLVNHYSAIRGTSEIFQRRQGALERLKPVFEFLEKNFADHISIQEAADVARLSKPRFMGLFREATGSSFIHYLNGYRVAKAQQLLETTELPISQVACEVGFCDQSYFGLVFRRHVRMAPLQYRVKAKQHSQEDQLNFQAS